MSRSRRFSAGCADLFLGREVYNAADESYRTVPPVFGLRNGPETSVLEQFLRYAADPVNGIWLDTVDAVARYIQAHRRH